MGGDSTPACSTDFQAVVVMAHQDLAERAFYAQAYGTEIAATVKTSALGFGNRLFHLQPAFGDQGIFSR